MAGLASRLAPLSFSPEADAYSVTKKQSATFKITATAPVVWNWSATGDLPNATVSNGGTASEITFGLSNNGSAEKFATITVSAGGNTWSIELTAQGTGLAP